MRSQLELVAGLRTMACVEEGNAIWKLLRDVPARTRVDGALLNPPKALAMCRSDVLRAIEADVTAVLSMVDVSQMDSILTATAAAIAQYIDAADTWELAQDPASALQLFERGERACKSQGCSRRPTIIDLSCLVQCALRIRKHARVFPA